MFKPLVDWFVGVLHSSDCEERLYSQRLNRAADIATRRLNIPNTIKAISYQCVDYTHRRGGNNWLVVDSTAGKLIGSWCAKVGRSAYILYIVCGPAGSSFPHTRLAKEYGRALLMESGVSIDRHDDILSSIRFYT